MSGVGVLRITSHRRDVDTQHSMLSAQRLLARNEEYAPSRLSERNLACENRVPCLLASDMYESAPSLRFDAHVQCRNLTAVDSPVCDLLSHKRQSLWIPKKRVPIVSTSTDQCPINHDLIAEVW